jgi:hypothetical protein
MKTCIETLKLATLLIVLVFPLTAQKRVTPVNLNVTFDDGYAQPGGFRSDAGGSYNNGQSGVIAQLTDYGWFNFDSGTRTATVDYSNPLEVLIPLPVTVENRPHTLFKSYDAPFKFQSMVVGSSQCAQVAVIVLLNDAGGTNRIASFHRADTNTAWAYVTHPDAATWTIESGPQIPCGSADDSLAHVARILDNKTQGRPTPAIVYGRWFVPFRLILTRQ